MDLNSSTVVQLNSKPKLCRICGGQALCFNFDVLTCGADRLFFYRNFHRAEKLTCRNEGNCEISYTKQRNCRKCRFDKCVKIGMKPKQQQQQNDENLSNQNRNETALRSVLEDIPNNSKEIIKIHLPQSVSKNYFEFTQTEAKYIEELLQSVSTIFNFEEASLPVHCVASNIYQILNLAINYVRRIIKYCKSNSVFQSLNEPEQLKVLRACIHKILVIRHAFSYDAQIDGFYVLGSEDGNCSVLNKCAVFYGSSDPTVKVLTEIKRKHTIALNEEMANDKTIRDLLIVQALFDFNENISCTEILRYHYWIYNHLLLRYLQCKYRNMEHAQYKHSMLLRNVNFSMYRDKRQIFHQALQRLDQNQLDELYLEITNIKLNTKLTM